MRENEGISARINELKTAIAAGVVDLEIRKRSARVRVLQNNLNRLLGLIEARAMMYSGQMGESRQLVVYDDPQEKRAISPRLPERRRHRNASEGLPREERRARDLEV